MDVVTMGEIAASLSTRWQSGASVPRFLLSPIGLNHMSQENDGAEQRNKRHRQLKHRSLPENSRTNYRLRISTRVLP
jgi:hypothetical protein